MKNKRIVVVIFILISFISFAVNINTVYANELSENIEEQLINLDLSELESFYNELTADFEGVDFISFLKKNLNGEYVYNAENFFDYLKDICFDFVKDFLPTFISVIIIAVICGFLHKNRNTNIGESVSEITYFAAILSIILLLMVKIYPLIKNTEIVIKNIAKLIEIMSPIIVTLMVAVGGNVSASVYKPIVAFFTGAFVNVVLNIIVPLILLFAVFNVGASFSSVIKFNKFADFCAGAIKWILGILATIFGLFLSIQGLTSAHFDGISLKAAKYAISNSVPIVGGFLKDGFDIVIAASVLIKNSIGVCGIVVLIYLILSPVLYLSVLSILLKLCAAILEPICDVRISNLCVASSKTCSYLIAAILTVALMFFILILMLILSANAFV